MKPLRYGLVGCGMMGQEHVRNVGLIDGVSIGAVYDPVTELASAAAALAGGAIVAPNLEALLAVPDLDAIVIVSPNAAHVGQMRRIAELRPLPLLVEKPLYTASSDRAAVLALGRDYPAPIWVAMEYRYMPPVAALIARAAAATGGVRMLTIREHRFPFLPKIGDWNRFNAATGGTLVEKCCHFFDLMRLILKDDPVRVMASGGQAVNHKDERVDGRVPDIWDHAYVLLDFASGARAMLELCMFAEGSRYQEEISAVGPTGKIEAQVPGPSRFWPETAGPMPVPRLVESPRAPKGPVVTEMPVDAALLAAGDHNGSTYFQHLRFAGVVRHGHAPEVSLGDGDWAVRVGLAAQESVATGQAVTL